MASSAKQPREKAVMYVSKFYQNGLHLIAYHVLLYGCLSMTLVINPSRSFYAPLLS
jgi:hypothetical protein